MKEEKEMLDEIVNVVDGLIERQKPYLEYLEECFEFIKYRNITRVNQIERLLDDIFNMFQTNETLDLYTRVCLYYHTIDKVAARDYAKFYLDLYEDDTVLNEINKVEGRIKKYGRIL